MDPSSAPHPRQLFSATGWSPPHPSVKEKLLGTSEVSAHLEHGASTEPGEGEQNRLQRTLSSRVEEFTGSRGKRGLLDEEMATHSSTLVWRISWTEGPGGLQSMGSHTVGHN